MCDGDYWRWNVHRFWRCWVGWHRWCDCCEPAVCLRCGHERGHEECCGSEEE